VPLEQFRFHQRSSHPGCQSIALGSKCNIGDCKGGGVSHTRPSLRYPARSLYFSAIGAIILCSHGLATIARRRATPEAKPIVSIGWGGGGWEEKE